jgi:hypothetical protein
MSQNITRLENAVELVLKLSTVDKIRLVEQVMTTLAHDLSEQQKTPKHSLLGMWSDISVSNTDIDEARSEQWANFPRDDI